MDSARAVQRNVQALGSSELQSKTSKMATNEATWSDKGTLSESVDVTLRNSDDRTELTLHILEDIDEENLESLKTKNGNENVKNFDTNNEESQRIRKLTGKGEEEKIRRLKQRRTNALTAVSRKRTDINKLMTDRRNLDVVKAELNQLDSLCQQFHDAHNLYYDELATPEETEIASRYLMTRNVTFLSTARKLLIGFLSAKQE